MHGVANVLLRKAKKCIRRSIKKNDNPVRWGIIGLGYMAECFSSAIAGNKDGIVVSVASRSIEKAKSFASKHGCCQAYGNYESMLHDSNLELDVVYIATPTKYHYEHIKLCLEAGKNVLCEKPITSNAQELEELCRLAKEKNCFLMEGMWMKCLPTYQKAISWVEEGRIGTPNLIKADFYKREQIELSRAIYNKNEGGGVLCDYGVYAIAFPTGFVQEMPEKLTGYSRESVYEIDSDWLVYMRFRGMQAFVNISSDFQGSSKAAIMGDKGTIEWNSQFNRTNVITLYDASGKLVDQHKYKYEFEGFEYEINEVQRCIRKGMKESTVVPLKSSMITMKMIDILKERENEV